MDSKETAAFNNGVQHGINVCGGIFKELLEKHPEITLREYAEILAATDVKE